MTMKQLVAAAVAGVAAAFAAGKIVFGKKNEKASEEEATAEPKEAAKESADNEEKAE